MLFRTRQMFTGHCTQVINPQRGHLAENGVVAPKVTPHIKCLTHAVEGETKGVPEDVRDKDVLCEASRTAPRRARL